MSQGTGRLIAHLQVHSQGIAQHPAQPAPSLHTHTHTYTYKHGNLKNFLENTIKREVYLAQKMLKIYT